MFVGRHGGAASAARHGSSAHPVRTVAHAQPTLFGPAVAVRGIALPVAVLLAESPGILRAGTTHHGAHTLRDVRVAEPQPLYLAGAA